MTASRKIEAPLAGEAPQMEINDEIQGNHTSQDDFIKTDCNNSVDSAIEPKVEQTAFIIIPARGAQLAFKGSDIERSLKLLGCRFVPSNLRKDKNWIGPVSCREKVDAFLCSKNIEYSIEGIHEDYFQLSKDGKLSRYAWDRIDYLEEEYHKREMAFVVAKQQLEANVHHDLLNEVSSIYSEELKKIEKEEADLEKLKKEIEQCRNSASLLDKTAEDKENSFRADDAWRTPLDFQEYLLPVPSLDPSLLPDPLRVYSEDVAHRMQCAIDFVAIPLLVVFSSLIGAGCAIRPKSLDSWTVTPNLWGGIIGPPSVLKSPSLNEAMIPLAKLERNEDERFERACQVEEIDAVEKKYRKERLEKNLKKAIEDENEREIESCKAALLKLEVENSPTSWRRYKTNDATIEKIAEILKDNPRGILVFRDELVGFLASLEKDGREGDRAFYLEGWNGHSSSPVKSDRIARGTVSCNPCISVLGGIQPSKLRRYLFDTVNNIQNDGFVQRFQLLVYPDPPKDYAHIDQKPNYDARESLINIASRIAETDFVSLGAKLEKDFSVPIFQFDPKAQEFFNLWITNHRQRLLSGDGVIIEHLAKYSKLMPSIALINCVIRVSALDSPSPVSLEDVQRAADLCQYLEAHARRIYSMLDGNKEGAKVLLHKLKEGALKDGFTGRDVQRKGWSWLKSPQDVEIACVELVEMRWLRERSIPTTATGGAPTTRYYIHPVLLNKAKPATDKTDKTHEN